MDDEIFEKPFNRTNFILKMAGLYLIEENSGKRLIARLRKRWFFLTSIILFFGNFSGVIAWFVEATIQGKTLYELTFPTTCTAQCLQGIMKTYYFLKYENHIIEVVCTLRRLQAASKTSLDSSDELRKEILGEMTFVMKILIINYWMTVVGVIAYGTLPIVKMIVAYLSTGKMMLMMPFAVWYPFDIYNIRIFPFMFIYVMFTTTITMFMVLGPDSMYYFTATYIQIQFRILQYDITRVVSQNLKETNYGVKDTFKPQLILLINRQKELFRCVTLIERVYSKSTLFNVMSSSLLICLAGFNATSNDDTPKMIPSLVFLVNCLLQIFWLCYFGDIIMQSSFGVSNAVYNCQWYNAEDKVKRELLFVLTRAQTPCKFTAYGFTDLNLATFMTIVSTAWSYFTLLNTVNN